MNAHAGISFGAGGALPPSSVPAEQALLGGLLANNKAYGPISGILSAEHFADPINAKVYKAAVSIIENGGLADAVTLKAKFSEKELQEVGGTPYLTKLLTAMVGIAGIPEYARTIRDTWLRRQVIDVCSVAAEQAYENDPDRTGSDLLDELSGSLSELAVHTNNAGAGVELGDAIELVEEEAELAAAGNVTQSISCGIPSMDRCMLRLRAGRLYVIGGRPGMGKSALAKTIAVNVALGRQAAPDGTYHINPEDAWGVGYTSMEESHSDLAAGILSDLSGIAVNDIKNGVYVKDTRLAGMVVRAKKDMRAARGNLVIFDKPAQTIRQITNQARELHRKMKGRLKVYIVDYVQIMGASPGAKDRRLSVDDDIQGLKNLARELNICVLALGQLNRAIDDRPNPRPNVRDLKETGGWEEKADVVCFPFREAHYHKQTKPVRSAGESQVYLDQRTAVWQAEHDLIAHNAEMDFPKVKQGEGGLFCNLRFNAIRTRFEECPV